jgi:ParB/RepB/Spo0J family partition protein
MKFIGNKEVPLSDIIPCPLLVEREDLGDIDSMTGDIFTPIIVRPSKEQLDKYERITGLRRFKKAEKDKKNTILCSIYEMTDEEAVLVHAKENLQRKNLNLIEEAREYENMEKRLSEIRGKKVTQEELAKILKKSQEDISNKKRLLKLAKPVQNYLALNKLGMYNALLLLQIKDDNLQTEIAEEAVANNYTTEKLKARIDKLKEELEYDEAVGQYRFRKNGSFYKPSPKVIQQPTKIKLVLQEPYCPRIVELIYEGYKYQRDNSENCPSCPVQDLCAKFVKYHDLLERKKVKEPAQEIKLIPKT